MDIEHVLHAAAALAAGCAFFVTNDPVFRRVPGLSVAVLDEQLNTMITIETTTEARRELPKGWRWVSLGAVCEIVMGQSPSGESYNNKGEGQPLLNGPTEFGSVHPTAIQWTTQPTKFASKGDVLLCVRGATTGRKNIADRQYCIGRGLAAIRGKAGVVETLFLFHLLDFATDSLLKETAGSTFPNLPGDKLEAFVIPLPPLSEQRRIAGLLNEQMAAVERARAAAEARLRAARALPAAYLREVFQGEEAQGWPKKKLGDISTLLPAHSIATQGEATVQAITTACLTEAGFDPAGIKTARMRADDAEEALVRPGEVLIARSNTPQLVGRVAHYAGTPSGIVASDLTIRIWPSSDVDGRFITYYLSSLFLSGYWQEHAGGASGSMKKITRSQLVEIVVPWPGRLKQQEVARLLEEKLVAARQSAEIISSELKAIEALPAALLRQAFSGEL